MYHYGWLWEELTLLSEIYADVMDVNRCNSAKEIPVPKFCFFDLVSALKSNMDAISMETNFGEKLFFSPYFSY